MTERTVTVPTETEETIKLCNECGLSDDAGELVDYGPWDHNKKGEYEHLHLHRECLEDMGVDVPEAETFEDVYLAQNTPYNAPTMALPKMGLYMLIGGITSLGSGAYVHDPFFMGIGILLLIVALSVGFSDARTTIEELNND